MRGLKCSKETAQRTRIPSWAVPRCTYSSTYAACGSSILQVFRHEHTSTSRVVRWASASRCSRHPHCGETISRSNAGSARPVGKSNAVHQLRVGQEIRGAEGTEFARFPPTFLPARRRRGLPDCRGEAGRHGRTPVLAMIRTILREILSHSEMSMTQLAVIFNWTGGDACVVCCTRGMLSIPLQRTELERGRREANPKRAKSSHRLAGNSAGPPLTRDSKLRAALLVWGYEASEILLCNTRTSIHGATPTSPTGPGGPDANGTASCRPGIAAGTRPSLLWVTPVGHDE